MESKENLEHRVLRAVAENAIGTIMFRNALAKRLGLNLTESLCLTILGVRGASSPTELAHIVGLTTGAMTTMLDRLEKRRLLRRKPNPNDRRGVLVEADETHARVAKPLVAGIQAAHREVISGYSEEQLTIIADFLTRFTSNLERHAGELEARKK